MNKQIKEKFISVVKKQVELYGMLKEIISEEQKILEARDVKRLDGAVKKEEDIISGIKKLEDEKHKIFERMAQDAGFSSDSGVKLNEILLKADEKDAGDIEKAVGGLIEAVKKTDIINANNTRMLKNYIEYVDFAKNVKEKTEAPAQTTYTADGMKKTEAVRKGPAIDKII